MFYDKKTLEQHLSLGEDGRREFKRVEFSGNKPKSPRPDDLANEISAFANATGGVLFCGVSDDGNVQSMSHDQLNELDTLISRVASDTIKPPVRIITHHEKLNDDERLLVVEIPKGDSLHESPGGAYIRVGNTKRKMESDEKLRLAQKRGQANHLWFDKQPLPSTGFATLDEQLWKPLISVTGAADPKAALEKMALLVRDDSNVLRATVAGALLCTRQPEQWLPSAAIIATCYRGTDRASGQIDSQEITGPLNHQVAAGVAFVMRNMRVWAEKTPARIDIPQYSVKAVFEGLVNAVAHRDYTMQTNRIRLSMFTDRLEIQSPGSLPNNLTTDSMFSRTSTRNETLTSTLAKMPVGGCGGSEDKQYFMERRGDGASIIRNETYGVSGKYPEYTLIDDAELRLLIPAATQKTSTANVAITVQSEGKLVFGVNLLVFFPNKTWQQAKTNDEGVAKVDLHTSHLPMTVFAAAPGYTATVLRDWVPHENPLTIELESLERGGSEIFVEDTGHLPGLRGQLSPIRDTHDRTYLYASNIAINDGQPQPVSFLLGEQIQLVDAHGYNLNIRIIDIIGRAALVEYVSP